MSTRTIKAPSFPEFVGLAAAIMAMMALAIDAILPALPTIGREFQITDHNQLHAIIGAFFMGAGVGQLAFGPLSDWLGRRNVLLWGIGVYVVLSLLAALVDNMSLLIALRFAQGLVAACASVISRAIVRDYYSGDRMAKVMSIVQMIFLAVPALAPALGQLILLIAPWRFIFVTLAIYAMLLLVWALFRLPETLPAEARRKPDIGHIRRTSISLLTNRVSLTYTLASTTIVAMLLVYLSLMPQVFDEVYNHPEWLAPVFAICVVAMSVCALLNSRIVEKVGARTVSHYAQLGMLGFGVLHFAIAYSFNEPLWLFVTLQALTLGCMSLSTSNFMSIAMEDFGHVAGTAASVQGFITMMGGSLFGGFLSGFWTGHLWLMPLSVVITSGLAMLIIFVGEKGRLFRNA
ncbi:multidrug effflux MFS transporter [Asticcacaulis tiandongensis]|uniref:multidrug effflux MFS transporter n=1 Tax=Asticcacaulis tiandongensis TaxID=2565365 RepID=UPI00112EF461|nr:multidrug effflux MFS transporter [Asticcacaulis tiandongensis]